MLQIKVGLNRSNLDPVHMQQVITMSILQSYGWRELSEARLARRGGNSETSVEKPWVAV